MKLKGSTKFWNSKGFTFVTVDTGGKDVFLHAKELAKAGHLNGLPQGTRVAFDIANTAKGPQAVSVEVIGYQPSETGSAQAEPDNRGQWWQKD
jgi:CspA family cold shock protein